MAQTGNDKAPADPAAGYRLSEQAAQFYEDTFVPALFADWAQRLVRTAAPIPGVAILDVACGTGIVARTAAASLDHQAHIVGLDLNPTMLAVARRADPALTWQDGDAAALPFDDATFDLVMCQAALMFFPDPISALGEMRRVARPGGRVVVQVPGRLSRSPGYLALSQAVTEHAGSAAATLLGSYFAAGDPGQLADRLERAGLVVEAFDTWTGATRLDSVDSFLDVELLPIADTLDSDTRSRLRAAAVTALTPYTHADGRIAAPLEVHLISAHPAAT